MFELRYLISQLSSVQREQWGQHYNNRFGCSSAILYRLMLANVDFVVQLVRQTITTHQHSSLYNIVVYCAALHFIKFIIKNDWIKRKVSNANESNILIITSYYWLFIKIFIQSLVQKCTAFWFYQLTF